MDRVRHKLNGYRTVREIAPQWGRLRSLCAALRLKWYDGIPPSALLLSSSPQLRQQIDRSPESSG